MGREGATMQREFLEIVFEEVMVDGDVEIVEAATAAAPGVVRLGKARIGEARPGAPNSRPVYSAAGGTFGFVADESALEGPYGCTYWVMAPPDDEQGSRGAGERRSRGGAGR